MLTVYKLSCIIILVVIQFVKKVIVITKNKNSSKEYNGKNTIIIILAIISVISVAVAIWALTSKSTNGNANMDKHDSTQDESIKASDVDESSETVDVLTDTIDLPQFAWINLKADSKEQDLTFKNPPQNFANIRVTIMLSDRTVLWTSKIISPGKSSEKVVLSHALSAGDYNNSILKYECFQNDEALTPLNGAENTLILKVN